MEYRSAWLIIARTNLHVGNESVSNFGIIDKAIQRDVVTELPCINSSSLKGAINEYATVVCTQSLTADKRLAIFGVDKTDKSKTQKGNTAFFDGNILALPCPDNTALYQLASCDTLLNRYVERLSTFGIKVEMRVLVDKIKNACGGHQIVYYTEEAFKELCSDSELPIIARNCLENGESKSLWYEQVLPRETVLGTLILSGEESLTTVLNNKIIQIGANATIGYGYCEFVQL